MAVAPCSHGSALPWRRGWASGCFPGGAITLNGVPGRDRRHRDAPVQFGVDSIPKIRRSHRRGRQRSSDCAEHSHHGRVVWRHRLLFLSVTPSQVAARIAAAPGGSCWRLDRRQHLTSLRVRDNPPVELGDSVVLPWFAGRRAAPQASGICPLMPLPAAVPRQRRDDESNQHPRHRDEKHRDHQPSRLAFEGEGTEHRPGPVLPDGNDGGRDRDERAACGSVPAAARAPHPARRPPRRSGRLEQPGRAPTPSRGWINSPPSRLTLQWSRVRICHAIEGATPCPSSVSHDPDLFA